MRKNIAKPLLSLLLAGVLLLPLLAGCIATDELATYKAQAKIELESYFSLQGAGVFSTAQREMAMEMLTRAKEAIEMATSKEGVDFAMENGKKEIFPAWWQEEPYASMSRSELHDETMRRGWREPTINDNFHDDRIIVFLKSEYSRTTGEIDEDEFRKLSQNFASIVNTSNREIAELRGETFRQRIEITLIETGKERVIEAVMALIESDMVLTASPVYIAFPFAGPVPPNPQIAPLPKPTKQ